MTDDDPAPPHVLLNGAPYPLPDGRSSAALVDLVASLAPAPAAVAVNDAVVPRSNWPQTQIRAGDRVEAVTAVAGG